MGTSVFGKIYINDIEIVSFRGFLLAEVNPPRLIVEATGGFQASSARRNEQIESGSCESYHRSGRLQVDSFEYIFSFVSTHVASVANSIP